MFVLLIRLLEFCYMLLPAGQGASVEVTRDLYYTVAASPAQKLDLYLPACSKRPCPLVILVSGGMWVMGNNRDYADICRHLAAAGIACAPITYRHMPPQGFFDQVNDIKSAVRWLRSHAQTYGIDPDRIGLFGSSAGSHLAGLAAFCTDDEGFSCDTDSGISSEVSAVFLLYGIYDLRLVRDNPLIRALAVNVDGWEKGSDLFGFYSPYCHIDGSEPGTCLMHGTRDTMVPFDQATALNDVMQLHNVDVELIAVEGAGHGFAKLAPWTRPMLAESMLAFFGRELGSRKRPRDTRTARIAGFDGPGSAEAPLHHPSESINASMAATTAW